MTFGKQGGAQDIRWDSTLPGFGIRIYPSGKKTFVVFYRAEGRQHIMSLGQYGKTTVEQARSRAKSYLGSVEDGEDPLKEKQAKRRGKTVGDLCADFLEYHSKRHKKTWAEDERRMNRIIIPQLGTLKVHAVTLPDIGSLHHELSKTSPYEANRVLELLKTMFNKAEVWGYRVPGKNPTRGVHKNKEVKRDRWVTPEEFPTLLEKINAEGNIYVRSVLWLYLLTGVRKNELLKTKWEDVDLERKELRLPDTKSGRKHYVPLSETAVKILNVIPKQQGNPYVFPGMKQGEHLVNVEKAWRRVRKDAGIPDVRLHDLRRTVGSWLAQEGNSLHVIGKVLNHTSPQTTAVYAHLTASDARAALDKHAKKVEDVAGPKLAEVIQLNETMEWRRRRKTNSEKMLIRRGA